MNHAANGKSTALVDIFDEARDLGEINTCSLSAMTGIPTETVARYMRGQGEPTFSRLKNMIEHTPIRLATAIISSLAGGRFVVLPVASTKTDLNGDDKTDTQDLRIGISNVVGSAAESLSVVIESSASPQLSAKSAEDIRGAVRNIRKCLETVESITAEIQEVPTTRRQAKPLPDYANLA